VEKKNGFHSFRRLLQSTLIPDLQDRSVAQAQRAILTWTPGTTLNYTRETQQTQKSTRTEGEWRKPIPDRTPNISTCCAMFALYVCCFDFTGHMQVWRSGIKYIPKKFRGSFSHQNFQPNLQLTMHSCTTSCATLTANTVTNSFDNFTLASCEAFVDYLLLLLRTEVSSIAEHAWNYADGDGRWIKTKLKTWRFVDSLQWCQVTNSLLSMNFNAGRPDITISACWFRHCAASTVSFAAEGFGSTSKATFGDK
jgi:hypothetical protein